MYAHACEFLGENGYAQYAAGRFCRPGHEYLFDALRRNGTEIVGMGVGAVTLLDGVMSRNTNNVALYVKNAGDFEKQTAQAVALDAVQRMGEYALGRLSLTQGLTHALFEARFGQKMPDALLGALRPLAARGWIEQTEAGFIPTPRGLFAAQNGRMKLEG